MNRAAIIMTVAVAALLGASVAIVCGILFAHHLRAGGRDGWRRGFGPPPGGRPPLVQVLPRLAHALDLTPEQIARIKPKVVQSQKEFEAARESLRSRIDVELTPAQRARWREMERKREMGRPFPGKPGDDHPDRPSAGEPGEPR